MYYGIINTIDRYNVIIWNKDLLICLFFALNIIHTRPEHPFSHCLISFIHMQTLLLFIFICEFSETSARAAKFKLIPFADRQPIVEFRTHTASSNRLSIDDSEESNIDSLILKGPETINSPSSNTIDKNKTASSTNTKLNTASLLKPRHFYTPSPTCTYPDHYCNPTAPDLIKKVEDIVIENVWECVALCKMWEH